MTDDSLALARRFLARGLSLFPVPRPRPGALPGHPGDGKVPALSWRDYQSRLPTPDELEQWFSTSRNIAIVTGYLSSIVVIDADADVALSWIQHHLPETPWQTVTSRGRHFYFRHPGRPIPNRSHLVTRDGRLPVDVRGDGGYVVAPGSLHASGTTYMFCGDWSQPRSELPIFQSSWFQPPPSPVQTHSVQRHTLPVHSTVAVRLRAQAYLATMPRPEIGCGSDQATFIAACRLVRGFALSPTDAEDLLWAWCGNRPGWSRTWIRQKVASALHAKEPIGALL